MKGGANFTRGEREVQLMCHCNVIQVYTEGSWQQKCYKYTVPEEQNGETREN